MSAATATEPTANKVKVEDAGPARKKLTITIPAEIIDEKLQESMSTLSTETALPGFRKGKVPQKLLERRFGTSVRTETKNQLVANAYAAAIEENQLKPVGEPEPNDDLKSLEVIPGKALTFWLEVEVAPSFELPKFDAIEVKKPMLEITKDMIEEELKRQQYMHGTPNRIEGDFKEGDRMAGYATVTKEGEEEPFFRQDKVLVVMPGKADGGKGQLLGLMIEGLADKLKGKKVGDTIEIDTVGPEAHEREDLRGAKLHMTFEIREAEHIEAAEPSMVAERYGLPSEEILREQIKFALEHRRDDEQASAMREQAIEQLAEMVDFELPEKMSSQQAARSLEQYRLELLYRGVSPEEVEERLADARGESESATRNRLKRFFLLHRLGEQFGVEVSEQEVNGRIAAIAAQRNQRPEKLRNELAQAGRLNEVARLIRDQKAADKLVAQVKQSEISADEWNELFKKKQKDAASKAKPARTTTKKPTKKAEAEEEESDKAAKPEKKSEKKKESLAKAEAPKKKAPGKKK